MANCLRSAGIYALKGSSYSRFLIPPVFTRASSSFESAVERSKGIADPDNQQKLKLYALFKQATVGKNTQPKPGMMELVKKAKWDAWNQLGALSKEEAQAQYIAFVDELAGNSEAKSEEKTVDAGQGLKVTIKDGIRTIFLNRPEKFNALTPEMYDEIARNLREANDDKDTNVVVFAAAGKFYCSGNDLSNFAKISDIKATAEFGRVKLLNYVAAYIDCRKPLIALIHGPAVGIAVTVLGMFDAVYASDQVTFHTPFSSLGQSPEACSSYTFPRIMGYAKASELLFFNTKITVAQAKEVGLVSEIFPHDQFQAEAWKKVNEIAKLPVKSIVYSKELVRGRERDLLHKVNAAECDRLLERWQSEDCINAIMKFMSRKPKS